MTTFTGLANRRFVQILGGPLDGMRAWLPIDREDAYIDVRPPCFLGERIHRPHRYVKQRRGRDIYLVHAEVLA